MGIKTGDKAPDKVREEYGVLSTLGLLPGCVTYVIDQSGTVRHVFNSQLNGLALHDERSVQEGAVA